jgi:hypothetical protein
MAISNTISDLIPVIRSLVKDQARNDGRDAFEYDNSAYFTLSESFPDATSIQVFINGTLLSSAFWTYSSTTNRVNITTSLTVNDIILITYSYYKKYSDEEITNYVASALTYFAQYRYHKVFEIEDDDKIVAQNNVNPSTDELYFIALIASILIDPQNIEVDTQDFKLTANRNVSDQEQINLAFVQFTRMVGVVSFERDDFFPKRQ